MSVNMFIKFTDVLGFVIEKLVAIGTGLMLIVVSCNVFARYILKIGLTWAEEFSLLLFVWVVFLGSYLALRKKSHLALTFMIKKLSPRATLISKIIILSLVALFLLALLIGGIEFVSKVVGMNQKTPLLGISAAWAYASLPASAGLMLIELVRVACLKDHILPLEEEQSIDFK